MLIKIRNTSTLVGLCAIEGYRLFPPCSMVGTWTPAVFVIACRELASFVSASTELYFRIARHPSS
jgi:hypothetical protein